MVPRILRSSSQMAKPSGIAKGSCLSNPALLKELFNSITSLIDSPSLAYASARTFESIHPYDHNQNARDSCTFPGATKLEISFDPDCATEDGCDYLEFFEKPGNDATVIFKATGRRGTEKWKEKVSIKGDTVYFRFKSDGSVNDWGYKFTVTPIGLEFKPSSQFSLFLLDSLLSTDLPASTLKTFLLDPKLFETVCVMVQHNAKSSGDPLTRVVCSIAIKYFDLLRNLLTSNSEILPQNIPISLFSSVLSSFEDVLARNMTTLRNALKFAPLVETVAFAEALRREISAKNLESPSFNFKKDLNNNPFINDGVIEGVSSLLLIANSIDNDLSIPSNVIELAYKRNKNPIVLLESPHPYENSSNFEANIRFPNAKKLLLVIDPLTATEKGCDSVVISRDGRELFSWSGQEFPPMETINGDSMKLVFRTDSSGVDYGFKIYVIPQSEGNQEVESDCQAMIDRLSTVPARVLPAAVRCFSKMIDVHAGLSNLIGSPANQVELNITKDNTNITLPNPESSEVSSTIRRVLADEPQLQHFTMEQLNDLFLVLKHLNLLITFMLPFIDFSVFHSKQSHVSATSLLSKLRFLIFSSHKFGIFLAELSRTTSDSAPTLRISRTLDGESVFRQISTQLKSINGDRLRHSSHSFNVELHNERANDAGGVFRDVICHAVDDLQNLNDSKLDLLIKPPNALNDIGMLQDVLVFDPCKYEHDLLITIGKLMGIGIRTSNHLSLCFPPMFWKSMVGSEISLKDYEQIDRFEAVFIDSLSSTHVLDGFSEISEDNFEDFVNGRKFVVKLVNGQERELIPNGANKSVTFETRHEFAELACAALLTQFDQHVATIKEGLGQVVPAHLFPLLTWQDMETLVCGDPEISIEQLQKIANYSKGSLSPNSPYVRMFWAVLESFTQKQRQAFLRFVWGRTRLPKRGGSKFQIVDISGAGLPISHTCFFQIDIPRAYTSQEHMRERFLYAIESCTNIDAD
ncbi:hypothetical protein RCL1_001217 [Eukaryota sp. TZLM3-RCL]